MAAGWADRDTGREVRARDSVWGVVEDPAAELAEVAEPEVLAVLAAAVLAYGILVCRAVVVAQGQVAVALVVELGQGVPELAVVELAAVEELEAAGAVRVVEVSEVGVLVAELRLPEAKLHLPENG